MSRRLVDSSTIPLIAKCMSWAKHRVQKAAVKLHFDLNLSSFLPSFAGVNRDNNSDLKMSREGCASIKDGEIVIFDKAYCDFKHLYHLDELGVFWVIRAKENIQFEVMRQRPLKIVQNTDESSSEKAKVMGQQPIIP